MSNESNRETVQVSPGELQASDFFPPGEGWNKDDEPSQPRGPNGEVKERDESATRLPRRN